jgi:hypothetical protein
VAHTSYSGGRDQEDQGSKKPALGKYFIKPYLKKKKTTRKKRTGGQ